MQKQGIAEMLGLPSFSWRGNEETNFDHIDAKAAREVFKWKLCKSQEDFLNITGEVDDVELDAESYGDTAITFRDISFSTHANGHEKVILEPLSGHFEPGNLVAVMGPSGSGKTTLLDILAGKKSSPHGGVVHFNGRPRDGLFPRLSAYVPQDDILPAHLTVKEAVMFHHTLKQETPSRFTQDMYEQRILKGLADLGLMSVKDSYIGDENVRGISGGEKRRTSLACGFAASPQVMFCDEPTSGLSATDAESCVKFMRLLAHKYRITIFVVIHQPRVEVAKLFDHLLLLTAQPGRCVFNGPMRDVPAFCAKVGYIVPLYANPTDFIMDLVTPGTSKSSESSFLEFYTLSCKPGVDQLVERQLHNERRSSVDILGAQRSILKIYGSLPPVKAKRYGVRFRRQLAIVGARQWTLYVRDSTGVFLDLAISIGKGLILGLTYMDVGGRGATAKLAFFFMLMMSVSIDGMKGMPKLIRERRVMKVETSEALYSEWAYIIPFTLISWAQAIFANTVFIAILFSMSSLQWALFPSIWLWTTMLYLTMDSMFLMLSAVAKDASTAMVMALPFFMFFLLFNGFTVSRAGAPWFLAWIVDISPVAYAIEQATMAATSYYGTSDFTMIIKLFGYKDQPHVAIGVMVAVQSIFRLTQVFALKLLNNIER